MPVGLYTRKGKNGRRMYFRDGKLISKKSYTASRGRSRKQNKRRPSTNRRRSTGNPRRKNMARYKRPTIPHPSITGMASGLAIATYLNKGSTGAGGQRPGVLKSILESKFSSALDQVAANAMNLATSEGGRKVLTTSIALAATGGIVRKWFPNIRLGGNKLFFRV